MGFVRAGPGWTPRWCRRRGRISASRRKRGRVDGGTGLLGRADLLRRYPPVPGGDLVDERAVAAIPQPQQSVPRRRAAGIHHEATYGSANAWNDQRAISPFGPVVVDHRRGGVLGSRGGRYADILEARRGDNPDTSTHPLARVARTDLVFGYRRYTSPQQGMSGKRRKVKHMNGSAALSGKVVLVTGGACGLGAAFSRRLVDGGGKVEAAALCFGRYEHRELCRPPSQSGI